MEQIPKRNNPLLPKERHKGDQNLFLYGDRKPLSDGTNSTHDKYHRFLYSDRQPQSRQAGGENNPSTRQAWLENWFNRLEQEVAERNRQHQLSHLSSRDSNPSFSRTNPFANMSDRQVANQVNGTNPFTNRRFANQGNEINLFHDSERRVPGIEGFEAVHREQLPEYPRDAKPVQGAPGYWQEEGSHNPEVKDVKKAFDDKLRTLMYRKFGDEIVKSDLLKNLGTSETGTEVTKIRDGEPFVYKKDDGTYFVTYDKKNAQKYFGVNEDKLSERSVEVNDAVLQKLETEEAYVKWDLPKVYRIHLENPEGREQVLVTDNGAAVHERIENGWAVREVKGKVQDFDLFDVRKDAPPPYKNGLNGDVKKQEETQTAYSDLAHNKDYSRHGDEKEIAQAKERFYNTKEGKELGELRRQIDTLEMPEYIEHIEHFKNKVDGEILHLARMNDLKEKKHNPNIDKKFKRICEEITENVRNAIRTLYGLPPAYSEKLQENGTFLGGYDKLTSNGDVKEKENTQGEITDTFLTSHDQSQHEAEEYEAPKNPKSKYYSSLTKSEAGWKIRELEWKFQDLHEEMRERFTIEDYPEELKEKMADLEQARHKFVEVSSKSKGRSSFAVRRSLRRIKRLLEETMESMRKELPQNGEGEAIIDTTMPYSGKQYGSKDASKVDGSPPLYDDIVSEKHDNSSVKSVENEKSS